MQVRTPIWAPNDLVLPNPGSCRITGDAKVSQLDTTILVREDVGALDVAVYDTLVMEVHEPFEDLRDVHPDKRLRELAKLLADVVERAVLAKSAPLSIGGQSLLTKSSGTHSSIMYRYSGVFSKPLYLTMLGC